MIVTLFHLIQGIREGLPKKFIKISGVGQEDSEIMEERITGVTIFSLNPVISEISLNLVEINFSQQSAHKE